MSADRPERRRDAAATRRALVDAAAALFADRGYERTTVRDIAARAGVNQALLFRYFGSKQLLFNEVTAIAGLRRMRETPPEELLETALRGLLATGPGPASEVGEGARRDRALEAFLRSTGGDAATRTGRLLGQEYAAVLATLTDADDAALRSDLILAWLLGIGLTRNVVRQEALAGADPEEVCDLVLRAARTMLEKLPPRQEPEP